MPELTAGEVDRLIADLHRLLGPGPRGPAFASADSVLGPGENPLPPEDLPAASPPAPLPVSAPTLPREPSPETAPRTGKFRVVVADDSKDYRRLLKSVLDGNGYEVKEAKDGAEGLKLINSWKPDLVLLDFEMPEMNGYEVIQALRGREETRKLPVVMLTGAPHRAQLKEMGLDISAFLEKPLPNAALLEAVSKALGGAPTPAENHGGPEETAPEKAEPVPEMEAAEFDEGENDLQIEEQKKEKDEEMAEAGLDVLANDSPLVNRINRIMVRAVDQGASDIHIDPRPKHIVVRTRLNGILSDMCRLPLALAPQVAARVKIMANLIITERRRPQDGQIRAAVHGKKVEFRVSTLPSINGEKIVMRILGGAKLKSNPDQLGLAGRDLDAVRKALESPHGLILVTGPTGSGKTTTLYTMIASLNTPDVNIMTAEDPVEYEIGEITQVQIRPQIGLTFESVLRSFLRQGPDIMLVGEIRDLETAQIAVKAAITGHLVFSTLHTNSAPATIVRLTHMGLAPYLVADSVKLIVAQRLVRVPCAACVVKAPLKPEIRRLLSDEEAALLPAEVAGPGSCAKCHNTGYGGRKPLFEVMEIRTPEMRQLILTTQSADSLGQQSAKEGMTGLRRAALLALSRGETTVEEALGIILAE